MSIKKLYFTKDYSKSNENNPRINVVTLIKRAQDIKKQDKKRVFFYLTLAVTLLILTVLLLSV